MPHHFRRAALAALLLAAPTIARAQGQDSASSTSGPQTSAHPPPILSQQSVTAVSGGRSVPPKPMPVLRPEATGGGFVLPGAVRLAAPREMACGDIADGNARRGCEGLRTPPAPPGGERP